MIRYRVASRDELPEGRVMTVSIDRGDSVRQLCLTRYRGRYAALDNWCSHQGGPLGEGSIECDGEGNCYLRCPWHRWDYERITGQAPGGFDDGVPTCAVEERDDGVYVDLRLESDHRRTVTDVTADTMVQWG